MRFLRTQLIITFLLAVSGRSSLASSLSTQYEGIDPQTQQSAAKKFPVLRGNSLPTADALDEIVQSLIKDFGFDLAQFQAETDGDRSFLKFKALRTPRISKVVFEGTRAFSEAEMRRNFQLSEGQPYREDTLKEALDRLKTYYEERGYLRALFTFEAEFDKEKNIILKVQVRENRQSLIKEIILETANGELKNLAKRVLQKRRRDAYSSANIADFRQEMRRFLSLNGFYKAELSEPKVIFNADEGQVTLTFQVTKSESYQVQIDGSDRIQKSRLMDELNLEEFFSNNPNLSSELASKLKNLYFSRGYAKVKINAFEKETDREFHRLLVFDINEGPRIKIKDIDVRGRYSGTNDFYVKKIQRFSQKDFAHGIYIKEELDNALERFIRDRQNEGYLRAKILSSRISYLKDQGELNNLVNIVVQFDEGPLTQIQKISFEGIQAFDETTLFEVFKINRDQPLKLKDLEDAIKNLKLFYQNKGYLEMNLLNEKEDLITYNEDSSLVVLKFRIYEGPPIFVNQIQIEGNSMTKNYVILKELDFEVGDLLTPVRIDESISRLQKTGHFASVDIKTIETNTNISRRTVVVRVADRDPGLLNFGVGATNERTITMRGYSGVAYRNLQGTGRGVSLRLDGNYNLIDIKYFERKVSFGYLEPYLFNTRTRGRLNFTQSVGITNFDKLYGSETRQQSLSLEQDLSSHLLLSWEVINFARYKDFGLRQENPLDVLTEIGSTSLNLEIDFKNHPFFPTKGIFSSLRVEYGSPPLGSNATIEYLRSSALLTHYWEVLDTSVWANSIRWGRLTNLKSGGSVPYDKKGFSYGGQSTLRGYQPSESFPNGKELGNDLYQLTTEANSFLAKSEIRFPVWGNWGGAVFYDGAYVNVQSVTFTDYYRDSAGVAARYSLPVGSLSLEYAWKLDYNSKRDIDPSVFHLSIGTF